MNTNRDHIDGKFTFGFFIGGLLGAIIIFLLGTKEGKKTGIAIGEKGSELIDEVMDKITTLEKRGKELLAEGEALKDHVADQIIEKKEELTGDVTQKLDSALAKIEAIQERGRETTASIRKKFKNIPKKSS